MTDIYTKKKRSEIMSKIKGSDTRPELAVRNLLHSIGYKRYSLHKHSLPGSPDIVFASRKKVIFVHGCFWHRHKRCKLAYKPKTNRKFWEKKIRENIERDIICKRNLKKLGYAYLVIWQCQLRKENNLRNKLREFLKK